MVLEDEIFVDFSFPINKIYTMVQQYDKKSRKILMQLQHKGVVLDITSESVSFIYLKDDEKMSVMDCKIVDAKNGLVSIILDENMCIINGISKAQVVLYSADTVVHSTIIKIRVAESIDETDITSSNDFLIFNELLEMKRNIYFTYISDDEIDQDNNIRWIQPIE